MYAYIIMTKGEAHTVAADAFTTHVAYKFLLVEMERYLRHAVAMSWMYSQAPLRVPILFIPNE